jgi:hypothetical protein
VLSPAPEARLPGTVRRLVRDFYSDRIAWAGLIVSALILTYGGGAAMFWFHCYYLGEGGPAISPYLHWALDSSAGLIGLTPPIAIIIPLAAWTAMKPTPDGGVGRVRILRYAVVGGVLLALVTAPAPLFHDHFLARGTWLADHITHMWGGPQYVSAHVHQEQEATPWLQMVQQVSFGIPTYVPLTFLALLISRELTAFGRRVEPAVSEVAAGIEAAVIEPVVEPLVDPAIDANPIDPI